MIAFFRRGLSAAALSVLLLSAGCAKAPSGAGGSPVSGAQVFVTLTVAGKINPQYYYYVLFNVNNAPAPSNRGLLGPVPVVAPPYGNGFAAGAITNYVEYNGGVPGGTGFGYYNFSDVNLLQPSYLGSTGYLVQSQISGNTLSFQIPLARLAPLGTTVDQINQLEVNFVTTNTVNVIGDSLSSPKYFDALDVPSSTGSFVNIIVRTPGGGVQSASYSNAMTNNETGGDVSQYVNGFPVTVNAAQFPDVNDLDITDWTIRINAQ